MSSAVAERKENQMVASEQSVGGKIYAAIPAMIAECEHISKSQKNQQQGFNYRGIDQVYNAVNPLLAKFKVFPCSSIIEEHREERANKAGTGTIFSSRIRMRYRFFADDGSFVDTEVIGEGMDSGDKASNKAMSIAYKYALFQLLCIPTMAVDPDAEAHEVGPAVTQAAPKPNGAPPKVTPEMQETYKRDLDLLKAAKRPEELEAAAAAIKSDEEAGLLTPTALKMLRNVYKERVQGIEAMVELGERLLPSK